MNDIEDFTTDQLRKEIHRREQADRDGRCWYCGQNLAAHTCKHSTETPCPAWIIDPPEYIRTDDCMGDDVEYWRVLARNPTTGRNTSGTGPTADAATAKCVEHIGGIVPAAKP